MKFGMILPSYGESSTRLGLIDTALAAERLGFDSIWTTDHLALPVSDARTFARIFEAVTTLGYLAASTSRVGLGISALVLPQRNPVEVAKQIATIDALSGGRVILAAGIGWSEIEYANLGHDFKNRARRMDEALKVLRTLWRGSAPVSFQGEFYRFEGVKLDPPPVQSGGPALWVAGNSPAALRRAIHYADGWHPTSLSAEELGATLAGAKPVIGARPFDVCVRLRIAFSDQPDPQARLSGTPDQVREQLRAYQRAGADHVLLYFQTETQAALERGMRTFQKEILSGWKD